MTEQSWDSLWTGGRLATFTNAGLGEITDGAIAVKDGRLAWVGTLSDLPTSQANAAHRVYDLEGRWVTPGLIDCHTHLIYGGNRVQEFEQKLQGVSYTDIAASGGGIQSTMHATRSSSPETLYQSAAKRLHHMQAHGTTTVEIKSGYGLDGPTERKILQVARSLGNKEAARITTTFLGAHTVPPEYEGNADVFIDMICRKMLPELFEEGLVDAVDAFCETVGFTAEQCGRVFAAAQSMRLPLKLHAEQLSNQHGAAMAARWGALSADHLEHVDDDGLEAMAKAGMVAVLLPGAFYFLRETKKPPVEKMRAMNIPMALATDCNPGTSPTTSLPLMMNMGCILFGMTPVEALRATTINAAKALGLQKEIGTLEVGKAADFAVWDVNHIQELTYHFGRPLCAARIFGGQVSFNDGVQALV